MGETLWERLCARFLGTDTSPLRNPVRFLVFVGGKALQAGGKDLFSLCPWLRILASDGSLGVVISVVCLFPAPTGKTGTPGFGFIGKLRLFFRIFTLDLLERTLAPPRCFLPGGISAELVPALLVPDAHTELLRRELSALISGESATLRASAPSALLLLNPWLRLPSLQTLLLVLCAQVSSSRTPSLLLLVGGGGGCPSPIVQPFPAPAISTGGRPHLCGAGLGTCNSGDSGLHLKVEKATTDFRVKAVPVTAWGQALTLCKVSIGRIRGPAESQAW